MTTRIEALRAKLLGLTVEMQDILLHALGIQRRCGRWSTGGWRNHFEASDGPGGTLALCMVLTVDGWLRRAAGTRLFAVTPAAIAALRSVGWKIEVAP